jgi:phosphoribosylamine--glycine ligase
MNLDFVLRCAAAGHEVFWYRDMLRQRLKDGDGFRGITRVDDWRPYMGRCRDGLILVTGNFKYMAELDRFRELGFKIFGPTAASAKLEIDREAGMQAMKKAGVKVAPYKMFANAKEALDYAWKASEPMVAKPMGSEADKAMTYVACDPADLVGWFQRNIKAGKGVDNPWMLQEKIDMACEFGVSGWFGPDGFLPGKWQIAVEHKKLCNGEIGPNTGEMGTVCLYEEKEKLADEALKPMEPVLKKLGHRGDFAIGVGIDTKGEAYGFEYTARLGYPAWFIQMAAHKGDPAQWMKDLLDGKDSLDVSRETSLGVVMGIPNYPYQSAGGPVEGNPIYGIPEVIDDVHLCSVMLGKGPCLEAEGGKITEGPCYYTTGQYVLVCTGLGATISSARRVVYRVVDKIKMANAIYRTDIGEKVKDGLPVLHKAGYALGLSYS